MGNMNKTNKSPRKIKARGWKGGYVVGDGEELEWKMGVDAIIFPGIQG